MIATKQRGARMEWEVLEPGYPPMPVRNRWIARSVRKNLCKRMKRLDISIRERMTTK